MAMDPDGKDFLLHLYDKLWENMAAKEGRLWNYLSVYGAAVALAAGVGHYAGVETFSAFIVLALTAWALVIVVNANWWYQRNRLMVTQIEAKFGAVGALDGVVPKDYRDAKFQVDRLYRASAAILAAIASVLYLKVLWEHRVCGFSGFDDVFAISLLAFFFLAGVIYCVSQHESYIATFYLTKSDLLKEAGTLRDVEIKNNVNEGREKAYASYSWKVRGALFLAFGFLSLDVLPLRAFIHTGCVSIIGFLFQLAVLCFYFLVVSVPARNAPWWRRTCLIQAVGTILIGAAIGIFMVAPYRAVASGSGRTTNPECESPTQNIKLVK